MNESDRRSSPSQSTRQGRGRLGRWRRWIIVLAVIVLLLVTIRGAISWRFHTALSAWEADGYPTQPEELWARRPEPEIGAAELYAEAMETIAREGATDSGSLDALTFIIELPEDGGALSAERLREAQPLVGAHSETRRLLHEAAAAGGGTLPRDMHMYQQPVPPPYLRQTRECMSLLFVDALLHAEAGDAEQALQTLETAAHLPGLLEDGLTMREALAADSIASDWAEMVEQVLLRVRFGEEELRRLSEAASLATPPAIWAEHVVLGQFMSRRGYEGFGEYFYIATGAYQLDAVTHMHDVRTMMALLPMESEPERLTAIEEYEDQPPPVLHFREGDRPRFRRPLIARYRAQATMRTLRASLAVLRYERAEGRLPDQLEVLVPDYLDAVPLDPFTGEPLKYRVLDDGFVIYSVNDNLVDSGGDDSDATYDRREQDIPFRVRLDD